MNARRAAFSLVGVAALALAVAGCGEKESESPSGGEAASVAVDSVLANRVPADIKADGKLMIGSDSTYAPVEFLDTDGKTIIGLDVDLFNAVAAKLGLKTEWESAAFVSVIPGIQSGKYEVGVSAFTISDERKQQVTMVSYFTAGTQWVTRKGSTINPDDACGKKIAVQTGTVQVDDITDRDKKCKEAGKPAIVIDQYQAQGDATTAVVSGKDDAMLADSPISAYAVKQTNGQLELVGDIYDSSPYGFTVKKDATALAEAIRDATKALIADGTYQKVLAKWGVNSGALTTDQLSTMESR
jgi:polar amino acid transport system substrate-binding protein